MLNLCSEKKINACTSGINIANVTYFIQKATKANAEKLLFSILQYLRIVALEKKDFLTALSYGFKDIEDAYQCVAAEKEGNIDYIITRNTKDFKDCSVPSITAEDFLSDWNENQMGT